MTKPLDPYSRVYWRIAEDPRFASIYPDERHLGTWLRLLMLADAMYPTAAPVPATARAVSVAALVDCGLIQLIPGGLYRVHGLAAERERRSRTGTPEVPDRNPTGSPAVPDRTPTGTPPEPNGNLARAGVAELSRDEQSQAETRTARAPDPADVYWTLTGRYPTDKVLGWVDELSSQYGVEAVTRALATAHTNDRSAATLLGRTTDLLRAEARALSLDAQAATKARLLEKRAAPREVVDPAEIQAEVQRILQGAAA